MSHTFAFVSIHLFLGGSLAACTAVFEVQELVPILSIGLNEVVRQVRSKRNKQIANMSE